MSSAEFESRVRPEPRETPPPREITRVEAKVVGTALLPVPGKEFSSCVNGKKDSATTRPWE
jgi:hypothetical protein